MSKELVSKTKMLGTNHKKGETHQQLFPVCITTIVGDKTASVYAYVTRGELVRIIENPNIDFEVED